MTRLYAVPLLLTLACATMHPRPVPDQGSGGSVPHANYLLQSIEGQAMAPRNAPYSLLLGAGGIKGTAPDGASAVGVILDTTTTYSAGKLLSIRNNGSEKFSVNAGGNGVFAGSLDATTTITGGSLLTNAQTLSTCSSGIQGIIQRDSTGGTGAVFTKLCMCRYDGTTAKWFNVFNPSVTTGTSTTCPN